ncbi:TetR family transcriptional regulator [Streptomyces pseudogriseolus]|uniref:TetR family transcriptional regulator n=1 Tax=Streptomyces pseudogriseolus TaxID=36817 RepID=UPI003FA1E49D
MRRQPVQERSRQTRDEILDVAARLFADRGYAGTTIQDVLTHSSATKGRFYHHFPDKESLAEAVVTESMVVDSLPPMVLPRLQAVVDASILLATASVRVPVVRAACRLSTEQNQPFYGSLWTAYIPLVGDWLTEARDLGELLPGVDPRDTAAFWVDAYTGVDMRYRYEYEQMPVQISKMTRQVVRGIATPETMMLLDVSVARGETLFELSPWAGGGQKGADVPTEQAGARTQG